MSFKFWIYMPTHMQMVGENELNWRKKKLEKIRDIFECESNTFKKQQNNQNLIFRQNIFYFDSC